jgi:serine/threonine protein kinase
VSIRPGQELPHYELVEQIGAGGMAVVWEAIDTTLDREVAIKFVSEAFRSDWLDSRVRPTDAQTFGPSVCCSTRCFAAGECSR